MEEDVRGENEDGKGGRWKGKEDARGVAVDGRG